MSIAATISADLRSRASYMPYCPLCSFVGVSESLDFLRGPNLRMRKGKDGEIHKINQCCKLSATEECFESPAAAATWWRARRLEPHPDIATENRRLNTIAKLTAKNFEPL